MTDRPTIRTTIQRTALLAAMLLCGAVASAQRGGGGPGGGGGGRGPGGMPGGMSGNPGMMGGPGRGDMGNRGPSPSINPSMTPQRNGPQLGPPGRWWDDKKTVKSLNLRSDQQRRMDDIFNANKTGLLTLYSNMKREEEKLSTMSREDLQDEAKVFAAIERVAQARAEMQKANAHILLQIRKELDAQQLAQLDQGLSR